MIRVVLPAHLRNIANVSGEVEVEVAGTPSPASVIDALEGRFPALLGTIRDPATQQRRKFVRFYACEKDLSLEPIDVELPEDVQRGREPFFVVGAMAGG
ncbi:MAG TPA: MoaD/ThiS family protein [Acidimicrobiales bacterium]|nr:MoaD/ThiS family protein [Acidimicrobiales bacterium]